MPENNKKVVFELNHPNWSNDAPYVESFNNSLFINEQLIFSDIYFQATDKEIKNRSIKKEKNIFFNYEQENIIKYVFNHNIGNYKTLETLSWSIKNNNSSPDNLYDINFHINKQDLKHLEDNHILKQVYGGDYYINDTLLHTEDEAINFNVFKQINLNKNEDITLYIKNNPKFTFLIKIENI
jgi:hypothetical protein